MLSSHLSPPGPPHLADDERWQTAQRLVDSVHFRRSPRLSRLLLYLSEQTLLDRTEMLTEYNIATRVFERQTDFDPALDTIVRSHMVRLRHKLEDYALENHSTSSIKVVVPKGDYLVRFERVTPMYPVATLPVPSGVAGQTASNNSGRSGLIGLCWLMGATILFLVVALMLLHRQIQKPAKMRLAEHPLWSHLFQPDRVTTFVAADSGLVLLHRMTGKDTTLVEYLKRDFSKETRGLSPDRLEETLNMANRRYTSFVDLNMFRRLQELPWATISRLEVKYARDIQMNELKQGNVILSGARGANPWLELYEPKLNFIGTNNGVHHGFTFLNRRPMAGEAPAFSVSEDDPKQRVLGTLSYLSNLDGNGNALIVQGNSMAGTEAISDFLFDDEALQVFLSKLKRPDGSLPHFEVLVESNSVNGSAGPFHILAYRTHP